MIDALMMLAAAPATALPEEAAATLASAPVESGLNYVELVLHASWPVQIVMLLLLVASVMSWFDHLSQDERVRARQRGGGRIRGAASGRAPNSPRCIARRPSAIAW